MIMKNNDSIKDKKIYELSLEVAKKSQEILALKRRIVGGEKSHDQRLFEANVKLTNDMDILKREMNIVNKENEKLIELINETVTELLEVQKWIKSNKFTDYYPDLNIRIKKLQNWNNEEEE